VAFLKEQAMKIKAAVLREYNKPLSLEELELDAPKEKEVLVKYAYTGFCHSDLHNILGHTQMPTPMIQGHEAAGIVEDVGPGVTTVKKGDHVVATFVVPCGKCPQCMKGMSYICTGSFEYFTSGMLLDGASRLKDKNGKMVRHGNYVSGFSTHTVIPEGGLIPIPKEFPLEYACLMGCCVPTGWGSVTNCAQVQPGDKVVVFGLGGVGLNTIRACAMRQAYPVIAVDLEESKEGLAKEFGATHFICNKNQDPVPVVKELTGGGADAVFEVIGDPGAIVQAFWCLGMAGKLVITGITPHDQTANLQLQLLPWHQISILGHNFGMTKSTVDIPKFVHMAMTQDMKLDKLVTNKFRLEDINDVVEKMDKRQVSGRWVCAFDE
jgi:S-(hydroxymethyl)glutathione dehydrogenase/alcohol dehydrogenase